MMTEIAEHVVVKLTQIVSLPYKPNVKYANYINQCF